MNILFIPHIPTISGRRFQISKHLSLKGHKVFFVLWSQPYPLSFENIRNNILTSYKSYTFKKEGITFLKIARVPLIFPLLNSYLFKKQIRKIYVEKNIDVILSQSFTNETEQPLDLPYIYDMNDYHNGFTEAYGTLIYKLSYKILGVKKIVDRQIKNAKEVIVVSDYLKEYAIKLNTNISKITNGYDRIDIKSLNNFNKINKHSLIYISTFGKWSKLDELIYSIKILKNEFPDILLIIVGEGDILNKARKEVIKYDLTKHIKFLGWINDRKKIFELIGSSEICINISDRNAFRIAASPIKFFEYASLGKKIISATLPEIKKLNYPNVFYYSEVNSTESIIKTIRKALNSEVSINREWKSMNNYSWSSLTNKIETLLKV